MTKPKVTPVQEQQQLDLQSEAKAEGPVECLGMTFETDEARRAHFTERLRKKLEDPEFRKTPGFPKGDVEDILRLSDPPYYTACPNPFLADFVARTVASGSPRPEYHRNPHAIDLAGTKNDRVYNAHGYHTKVPPAAIEQLIEHYTQRGDIVLDPFCGSGMTGVAAARTERSAVLADLSPAATSIADGFIHTEVPIANSNPLKEILGRVSSEWGWLYETRHVGWDAAIRDPGRRSNVRATEQVPTGEIQFVVWSDVFVCSECGADIVFWDAAVDTSIKGAAKEFQCSSCSATVNKRTVERRWETLFDRYLGQPRRKALRKPVLINYTFNGRRYEKSPDEEDLAIVTRVRELGLTAYPATPMLHRKGKWGDQWREGYHSDVTHAHDFLFERSSVVLSAVWDAVRDSRELRFWFTSTLPWCTRENRLHLGNYFGKKGGVITSLRGTLYFASLMVETNPLARLKLRAKSASVPVMPGGRNVAITTQSASALSSLPDSCIDYCFVDPPFGHNLMYSELNFQWEAWLRVFTEQEEEAIVSKTQSKGLTQYAQLMHAAFSEVYRTLRAGRWMTVEFHNSRNSVWMAIQEALQRARFVVADVRVLDKGKGSFNAVVASGAVSKDLIISAYKPAIELEEEFRLEAGTAAGVWNFTRNHLGQLPIFLVNEGAAEVIGERQNHLLFDRMVAFHVQRGATVPLSAADFYEGLLQRYSERDGMYFLPWQVAEYDRRRNTVAELRQLTLFVTDEASAIQWLRQQLHKKPQTFQDLQPQFMRELQSWAKHERTVELREMLEQNFLHYDGKSQVPSQIHAYLSSNFKDLRNRDKDDSELRDKAKDRWYVPDPGKQVDLEQLRDKALLREFEDYKTSTQRKLKQFRTEALRAGFKAAYDAQDYKCIVDVAKKIPENVLQEDEKLLMYYDVASMRLGEE